MEAQDEEDILSSLEWNEAGASPDEFALKHGIRHTLRAHAAALPEVFECVVFGRGQGGEGL